MIAVVQNLTLLRGITFDSFQIACFEDADFTVPFDATGWTPWSEVRSAPDGNLILNLNPFFSNYPGGIITVPAIQDEDTILLTDGKYKWDVVLEDPTGQRFGPYIKGSFIIKSKITQGDPPE